MKKCSIELFFVFNNPINTYYTRASRQLDKANGACRWSVDRIKLADWSTSTTTSQSSEKSIELAGNWRIWSWIRCRKQRSWRASRIAEAATLRSSCGRLSAHYQFHGCPRAVEHESISRARTSWSGENQPFADIGSGSESKIRLLWSVGGCSCLQLAGIIAAWFMNRSGSAEHAA